MRSSHPTDDALALYAAGELDELAARGVEVHVRECAGCGDRLAQAAAAELALLAIAGRPDAAPMAAPVVATPAPARRVRRATALAAGAVATAAAILLAVRAGHERTPAPAAGRETTELAELADEELFVPEAEDDLELPSGAEMIVFIPEGEP